VGGNEGIIKNYPKCKVYFGLEQELFIDQYKIVSHFTPGHCAEHFVYEITHSLNTHEHYIFTGDLWFQGGVGRCMRDGNPHDLANSLIKIKQLMTPVTLFYPGHDYLVSNLRFANAFSFFKKQIENVNMANKPNGELLHNTITFEEKYNLFLWVLNEENWKSIPENERESSPLEQFKKLRFLKDQL
jgi:glyoxylase-like metal-dependent hydrolase (beta-lactamase superfamily II)